MRRVYVNIAAFLVLSAAAVAWSVANFLHLDLIEKPAIVVAEFEESPGLRSGYEVTYLGHSIGRIRGVRLAPGISEVELAIDRDVQIPADVVAAARRRSAIGEPYVDLAPAPDTDADAGPRLADGDRIDLSRTSSPLRYGDLFRALDTLVQTVDADALGTVTEELAAAVDGRGNDIRRIVTSSRDLTTTLAENGDQLEGFIDDVADITAVLATNRDALGSGIDSLAGLTQALEQARPSFETLLDEGPSTLALMNAVVDAADHAVICTVDGTAVLDAVLDEQAVQSLSGLLQRSAAFADVVRLVQDPRDGIFRLYISPSGGNPPTVEFAEPKPFPGAPEVATCPERALAVTPTGVTDEAGEAMGGERPGRDGSGDASDRPDAVATAPASGTGDADPGPSLLARIGGWLWPWALLLAILAAAAWYAYVQVRRRGASA